MSRLIPAFEQFFDSAGDPLVSGLIDFFEAGSSTVRKATFADSAETKLNPNPVVLNGDGRAPNIFGTGSYRAILRTAAGGQILQRDPVGGDALLPFGGDWSPTQIYSVTDVVRDGGDYWESQVSNNLNNKPSTDDGTNWKEAIVSLEDVTQEIQRISIVLFDNVADMITGTLPDGSTVTLSIGETVSTKGRLNPGDGGDNQYEIVAAATGTDDGGSFIDLATHQAKGLFPGDIINVRQFGAVGDDSTDDRLKLFNADAFAKTLTYTEGTYLVSSALTLTADSIFDANSIIKRNTGITVTLTGSIQAGDYQIFDVSNTGVYKVSAVHRINEFRITWFGALNGDESADATNQTLADNNMLAIKEAVAAGSLGISAGQYRTPITRIPTGLFFVDDDDSDGVGVSVPSYATIKGEGWSSVIRPKDSAKAFDIFVWDVDASANIIMDDFQIWGEASLQVNAQIGILVNPASSPIIYSKIGNGILIKEMNGNGIKVTGSGLDNSTINAFQVRDSIEHNLLITACDRLTVRDGTYRSAKTGFSGITIDGAGVISARIINNDLDENNVHGLLISNTGGRCEVKSNRASSNFTGAGYFIDRADGSQINNNFAEQNDTSGFVFDQCDNIQVNANEARANQQFGLVFSTVANSQIHDNEAIGNSQETDATFDGINLQSNSDDNSVQGNVARHLGGASQHRFGIRIEDAASGTNVVTNNDLKNSGRTGSFSDIGTGTVTTAGNRL